MPAFRVFHAENGHLDAPASHPALGRLVRDLREGKAAVPTAYVDEIASMGNICTREQAISARWGTSYMPAFRAFHFEHGHLAVPSSHPVLGRLVCALRTSGHLVPSAHTDELLALRNLPGNHQQRQGSSLMAKADFPVVESGAASPVKA